MIFEITKSCKPSLCCCYPSCVEEIVEVVFGWYPSKCRGDCWCFGFEPYPSSVEVIVGVLALSLIPLVRGDCYLAKCPSL